MGVASGVVPPLCHPPPGGRRMWLLVGLKPPKTRTRAVSLSRHGTRPFPAGGSALRSFAPRARRLSCGCVTPSRPPPSLHIVWSFSAKFATGDAKASLPQQHRAKPVRSSPAPPLTLLRGHCPWVLVRTGARDWHGVGGFVFNSPSSLRCSFYKQKNAKKCVLL